MEVETMLPEILGAVDSVLLRKRGSSLLSNAFMNMDKITPKAVKTANVILTIPITVLKGYWSRGSSDNVERVVASFTGGFPIVDVVIEGVTYSLFFSFARSFSAPNLDLSSQEAESLGGKVRIPSSSPHSGGSASVTFMEERTSFISDILYWWMMTATGRGWMRHPRCFKGKLLVIETVPSSYGYVKKPLGFLASIIPEGEKMVESMKDVSEVHIFHGVYPENVPEYTVESGDDSIVELSVSFGYDAYERLSDYRFLLSERKGFTRRFAETLEILRWATRADSLLTPGGSAF